MTEQDFLKKGFNAGYELEKHAPEMSKSIQDSFTDKEHPYAVGFIAGSNEYVNERGQEKKSSLSKYDIKDAPSTDKPKENDLDMER